MSSAPGGFLFLSGIGPLGATSSLLAPPVGSRTVASSGAALATLARCIGGSLAVSSLFAKPHVRLLEGSGTAGAREALGRSWLQELQLPEDLELSDLSLVGCEPCSFLLYCSQEQMPVLLSNCGPARASGPVLVREVAAALCSQTPVRVGARLFLDAERIFPPECLAAFLDPSPFFCFGPPDALPTEGRVSQSNPLHTTLVVDRLLRRHRAPCPYFRPSRSFLHGNGARVVSGAAFLCYLWACALQVLPLSTRACGDLVIPAVHGLLRGRPGRVV
jgi:hypothetical protein